MATLPAICGGRVTDEPGDSPHPGGQLAPLSVLLPFVMQLPFDSLIVSCAYITNYRPTAARFKPGDSAAAP